MARTNPLRPVLDAYYLAYQQAVPIIIANVAGYTTAEKLQVDILLEIVDYNFQRLDGHIDRLSGIVDLKDQPSYIAIIETITQDKGAESPEYLRQAFNSLYDGLSILSNFGVYLDRMKLNQPFASFQNVTETAISILRNSYYNDMNVYTESRDSLINKAFETNAGNIENNPYAQELLERITL